MRTTHPGGTIEASGAGLHPGARTVQAPTDRPPADGDASVAVHAVESFFDDLANMAAAALSTPDCDVVCGITIERGEAQTTVASSSARASLLDEIQYELDRGPCLHALRTNEVVHIPDMEQDASWPMWRERAIAADVRSSLAIPVPGLSGIAGGAAFNFYAEDPHAFSDVSVQRAQDYARRAVGGVKVGLRLVEVDRVTEHLRAALGSRSVIDQALGVIMAENRCDAEEAFKVLRRASHNRNVKLRLVAGEIVERVTNKAPVAPPQFTPPTARPGPRPVAVRSR